MKNQKNRSTKIPKRTTTKPASPTPPQPIEPSHYSGEPIPGLVRMPLQLHEPEDTEQSVMEERKEWYKTSSPDEFDFVARSNIQDKVAAYHRKKYFPGSKAHTISRIRPRDTSDGIYPGASEGFHHQVAKACEKGQTPDTNALDILVQNQPYRKALAMAKLMEAQPLSTYGPMQLPQSYDPVDSLDHDPAPEPRPTHWEPGAPVTDMLAGTLHDFGNLLTALVARQVVAMGYMSDTEAIANARSLGRTIKDFQKMARVEHDRTAPKPRKTSPGRPPKRTFLDPEKAVTIRLEIVEKNKKFRNKKYCTLTPDEPTPEADLNAKTADQPKSLPTPAKPMPEADLNTPT